MELIEDLGVRKWNLLGMLALVVKDGDGLLSHNEIAKFLLHEVVFFFSKLNYLLEKKFLDGNFLNLVQKRFCM